MTFQYKIRTFESGDYDGATCTGTIVLPISRSFYINAKSVEDAEMLLRNDVLGRRRSAGLVYRISPPTSSLEPVLALAAALDGSFSRVILAPGAGLCSEFCRIALPDLPPAEV
jgi:hypothetical protein